MVTYPMGRPTANSKKYRYSGSKKRYVRKTANTRSKPSRFAVSKKRYSVAREVSKQLQNYGENKFQGFAGGCLPPQAKPLGSQPITYQFLNSSNALSLALPEYTPMNLFYFPQGDQNDQRTGDYMYLRQSYLKLEIQMLPVDTDSTAPTLNATTDFRFMVVKANRKNNPYGKFPDPGGKLFLNTQNDAFGYDDTSASVFQSMNQPINKRDFLVYCDKKFTLSPPSSVLFDGQEMVSVQNSRYPIKKRFNIKLPCWKKTHFDNDTNVPTNIDSQWFIICQAVPSAYCDAHETAPNLNWVMSAYGTTSARDS